MFPEDVWNLIKEFCISKEAKWLYAMRNADVYGLRSFLYSISLTSNNGNENKLKGQIIRSLHKSPEHAKLLNGVQVGVSNCIKYLRVGEEVLVFHIDTAEDKESFECYRKGVVRKINPLQVALYNFELIQHEPRVVDMIWLDTFDKMITIKKEEMFCIKQKGFLYQIHTLSRSIPTVFNDEFKIGKRKIHGFKIKT